MNIFVILRLIAAKCTKTYVVQTKDDRLHFISNHIESFPLPYTDSFEDQEQQNKINTYNTNINDGLVVPHTRKVFDALIVANKTTADHSLTRMSRLDSIFIENDCVVINSKRLQIQEILQAPYISDGVYISATQEHVPTAINNTIVIIANTRVFLLDFFENTSKTLKHKQVLYLFHAQENIKKRESEIYLNNKWWKFDYKITAVFVIKEKDGFNFMLRLLDSSEMVKYHKLHGKRGISKIKMFISVVIGVFLIFYFTRNLKYKQTIIKNKLFAGEFVKKPVLIYRVNEKQYKQHHELFSNSNNTKLVHLYYESFNFWNKIIVTEMTYQFSPVFPAEHTENESNCNINENFEGTSSNDVFFDERFAFMANPVTVAAINKFKADLKTVVQMIEGLHECNQVHGSICPENIRITKDGEIKMQKYFQNDGWKSTSQLKNIKNAEYVVTCNDDIFSLGCILHYYMTDYHPFDLRNFVQKARRQAKKKNSGKETKNENISIKEDIKNEQLITTLQTRITDEEEGTPAAMSDNINDDKTEKNCKSLIFNIKRNIKIFCSTIAKLKGFCIMILLYISQTRAFSYLKNHITTHSRFQTLINKLKHILVYLEIIQSPVQIMKVYEKTIKSDTCNYIEYNILFGSYKIRLDDQVEHDFIYHTIKPAGDQKPIKLSTHPYFWDGVRCLEFICDVSDFLESNVNFKVRLERTKKVIFHGSWFDYLDSDLIRTVSSKRTYDFSSLCDLIRFVRNCHRHFQAINTKSRFAALEGRLFGYLSYTFPEILMFLYRNSLFKDQPVLAKYYECI